MFTGLIAEVGRIGFVRRRPSGLEYEVSCPEIREGLDIGSSVAVNGVCQTVTKLTGSGFITEAVESTLLKTTIGDLRRRAEVNLEPALRAGDPLDGHIMQGHVQVKARLLSIRTAGLARVLRIETGDAEGIIAEGSVGIDGISLTVSEAGADGFTVHIIPETWKNTTLRNRRAGELLNIEGDILARGLPRKGTESSLDESKLIEWGY